MWPQGLPFVLRVFGRLPDTGVSERTEAGVRKASGEETAGVLSPAVVSGYGDLAPEFDLIGGLRTRAPAAPVGRCLRLVAVGGIGTTMSRRAICVLAVGVGADGCDRRGVAVAGGIPAWTTTTAAQSPRQVACGGNEQYDRR